MKLRLCGHQTTRRQREMSDLVAVSVQGGHLSVGVDVPDGQRAVGGCGQQQCHVLGHGQVLHLAPMSRAAAASRRYELTQRLHTSAATSSITSSDATIDCLQCFDAVGWAAGRASGL